MKTELIYPELSYQIMGYAFKVHNTLGGGLPEKVYQNAMAAEFEYSQLKFREQNFSAITYRDRSIKRNHSDFLVEDLIIVELKSYNRIVAADFKQVKKDLIGANKKLGILLHFGTECLNWKRVLNLY
jgi:GxxExxY protein